MVGDDTCYVLMQLHSCLKCSVCRSSDDQEVLFDQILLGQLEFPLPYWDNVSDTAKVNVWNIGGNHHNHALVRE